MRLDRLYAITLVLANGGKTTAGALAERFGVSVRTIYRDLEALDLAGVPIVAVQGTGGGVSLMDGYRVDGGYFSRRELNDLASTLRGIAPLLSGTGLVTAAGKVDGLRREVPDDPSDGSPVTLNFDAWREDGVFKAALELLVACIREENAVEFTYTSLKPERSHRIVEPLTVVFRGGNWYLSAWCRTRKDYRWFTISRLEDPRRVSSRFHRRQRLDAMPRDTGFHEPPVRLRLALTPGGAVRARPYISGGTDEATEDGRIIAVVEWPANEWLYSFLMGLGPDAEVLEPPEIRSEIRRRLNAAAELYEDGDETSK